MEQRRKMELEEEEEVHSGWRVPWGAVSTVAEGVNPTWDVRI